MNAPLLDKMKDTSGYDRTFKRYRISFPMSIQAAEDETADAGQDTWGEIVPGLAHNLSLSGIGFVCSRQFALESRLEIEITLGAQTFALLACVRWCQPLNIPGEALYHYGAQFVRTEAVLEFIPVAANFLLAQGSERLVRREAGIMPSVTPGTVPVG